MDKFEGAVVVYDANDAAVPPAYLMFVDGEMRLYAARKLQDQYTLIRDSYQVYSIQTQQWGSQSEKSGASPIKFPRNLTTLSDQEKKILVDTLKVDRMKQQQSILAEQLQKQINSLIAELIQQRQNVDAATPEKTSIEQQIEKQYTDFVIATLQACMQDFSLEKCETVLKNHWNKIKGTALCYTALPEHPATALLCDIATQLASIKKVAPIHLLMPGVFTESQFPDTFPDLDKIDIQSVLKTHFLSEDHQYLLPVTLLAHRVTPTTFPNNAYPPITIEQDYKRIFNPYRDDDHQSPDFLSDNELRRLALYNDLLHTLFKLKKEYDDIVNDKSTLLGQLNQLICQLVVNSASGRGREEVAASGAFTAISTFNEYYENLTREQKNAIPADVKSLIDKLISLASTKQTDYKIEMMGNDPFTVVPGIIYIQKKAGELYYSVQTQQYDLINKVNKIIDVANILLPGNITSAETDEDKTAILEFLVTQKHIPESKQFFISQAHEMRTCIGIQSHELRAAVNQHQAALNKITISENTKTSAIERTTASYDTLQLQLAQSENMNGRDHYGVSKKILELLHIQSAKLITNEASLKAFLLLSNDEIRELCALPNMPQQIIRTIGPLENFVFFIAENSPEKINVLFSALADMLCDPRTGIIKIPSDLSELLIALPEDNCRAVCEALKDKLPKIIKTSHAFKTAIENLNEVQRGMVFEALKNYLPAIINGSSLDFSLVLRHLNESQCRAVCEMLKDQLHQMIKTAIDFKMMLGSDNEAQFGLVFGVLKDQLPQIIKTVNDFREVTINLNEAHRGALFEAIKGTLSTLIKNAENFEMVTRSLNYAQRITVFQSILLHTRIINDQFINQQADPIGVRRYFSDLAINSNFFLSDTLMGISHPITFTSSAKIQLLHQHFYDLFSKEEHRANPNIQHNRQTALKLIQNEILHILENATPWGVSEAVFKQAEQFLLLPRELQSASAGGVPEQDPLKNPSYLKYKKHYDKSDVDLDAELHALMAAAALAKSDRQNANPGYFLIGTTNRMRFNDLSPFLYTFQTREMTDRVQPTATPGLLLATQRPTDLIGGVVRTGTSLQLADSIQQQPALGSLFAVGPRTVGFFDSAAATRASHAARIIAINNINNVTDLARLLERTSEGGEDIYQLVMRDENFYRITHSYPEALSRLVRLFPAHKEDFYNKINTNRNFDLFTHQEVEELANLVRVFPEHKEEFYNRVNTDLYFRHFAHSAAELGILIRLFPEHEQALNNRFTQGSGPALR